MNPSGSCASACATERFPLRPLDVLGGKPMSFFLGPRAARKPMPFPVSTAQLFLFCVLSLLSIPAPAAQAGTVTGTVTNGTNGKPVAGVQMILIQLQGGMQPVDNTKTDADGRYRFTNPGLGGQMPMLIRAVYRDVFYHEAVAPGKTIADVTVYEPTNKPGSVSVATHVVILQPSGSELLVGEEFSIENKTQPPMTYYVDSGSFLFQLPEGATLNEVAAAGASGMPVVQSTLERGKNLRAIAYAFRPGENLVRISYKIPYPNNQTKLRVVSPYLAARVVIATPPTVQVAGDGLAAAAPEQGFSIFTRDSVAANAPLNVIVSGTAPAPPQHGASADGSGGAAGTGGEVGPPADNSQNPSVNSRLEQSGAEAATSAATTMPARLDSLKWILVVGFAALFSLGFIFLWRRPQAIAASSPAGGNGGVLTAAAPLDRPTSASPSQAPAVAGAAVVAEADTHVRGSLDELKDTLFRLELRRQAGTIAADDYASERQRIEQLLRDLVRG